MSRQISLSVCTYQDGSFEVMILDPETGREVTLSGDSHNLDENGVEFILEVAPACVFTRYERVTPEG